MPGTSPIRGAGPTPSQWSVDTLKEYFETLLQEKMENGVVRLKEYIDTRLKDNAALYDERASSVQRAIDKTAEDMVLRFESVNEFRRTLADQTATFITADSVRSLVKAEADKIDVLDKRLSIIDGRGVGASSLWGYIAGAFGFIALVYSIVSPHLK